MGLESTPEYIGHRKKSTYTHYQLTQEPKRYQSMYVREKNSESVERMLAEHQDIKEQFLEHVEGLYIKLENQIEKKRRHLNEVKKDYDLDQRRREFKKK